MIRRSPLGVGRKATQICSDTELPERTEPPERTQPERGTETATNERWPEKELQAN